MRQAVGVLVVALVSMLSPARADELSLSGSDVLGCAAVRGEFVGFLVPAQGIVLLADQSFPGGSPAGTVRDGALLAEVRGLDSLEFTSDTATGVAVWGMLDRSLEIGEQRGCFAFGEFRWSSVDDLKTYLHWIVREVLANIPWSESTGEPAPLVELADRRVTLEIHTPDHRVVHIRGVEGTTLGYRPRDSETTFFFQPFIVGPGTARAAVRVSSKQGDFFGPGVTEEIAFVGIGTTAALTLPTDPPLALRLARVEAAATEQ